MARVTMEISPRQSEILRSIVEEYVRTAHPVGSAQILKRHRLGVSAATVRTEMAALEEAGLLVQPHTSAGRAPTDAGFRFYIDAMMRPAALTKREEHLLQEELLHLRTRHNQLVRATAQLLAGISRAFAVSGVVSPEIVHRAGFSALLEDPGVQHDSQEIERMADTFRYLDERVEELFGLVEAEVSSVFVGEENPVPELQNVSMVLSRFRLPDGEEGLVAIVGPRRMQYAKNISLVEYVRGLLGEGQ